MYRRGTYFLGPGDNYTAEGTIRDILRNKSKPFLRDIDNLRASFDNTDDLNIPPNLRAMVNDCWEHNWRARLSKSDSGKLVDLLNKNMHSSSLVESLLDRMEDYSCHLEDLVEGMISFCPKRPIILLLKTHTVQYILYLAIRKVNIRL